MERPETPAPFDSFVMFFGLVCAELVKYGVEVHVWTANSLVFVEGKRGVKGHSERLAVSDLEGADLAKVEMLAKLVVMGIGVSFRLPVYGATYGGAPKVRVEAA
jgi:hypothetical protein